MNVDAEVVHVTFGTSRAQSIRYALLLMGIEARVIAIPGDLNLGPIDPPSQDTRRNWIRTTLRFDPLDDWRDSETPWVEATSPDVYPVYWVCKNDAGEHACFLEFNYRMDGRPFDIVDATDLVFTTADGIETPRSLGVMRPEDIMASGMIARRRLLSREEGVSASATWTRLRRENAPIRIVRDGNLVSAPLTYFDDTLVSQASPHWEVAAALIGRAMHCLSQGFPGGDSPGDVLLFGRVLALGDAGGLKIKGAGPGMRNYEVRSAA